MTQNIFIFMGEQDYYERPYTPVQLIDGLS